MSQCKEWFVPPKYFLPLCPNEFYPAADNDGCPICVRPEKEGTNE